jgi:2-amino-4-hydroxy-6-hydroxymethyldihydropteridine diphosphokinase
VPTPHGAVRVVRTSFLYETPPAYVVDQPRFLNAAVEVHTTLAPAQLLAHIKDNVEEAMGREHTVSTRNAVGVIADSCRPADSLRAAEYRC